MVENEEEYVPPDGWSDVTPDIFAGAPFKLYANHFKSGSDRLKAFMDDPRGFLQGQTIEPYGVAGEAIEDVNQETRVSTWITNHHNTLQRMILYATAIASPSENSVAVTTYKYDPGE